MGRLNATSGIVLGAGNSFPKTMAKLQRPDLVPPGTRTLNIMDIGRHLADDDIDAAAARARYLQSQSRRRACRPEPHAEGPDARGPVPRRHRHRDDREHGSSAISCCLRRRTSSATTSIRAYGHHWLQRGEAAIPPVGDALPNTEIFRRLAARFGFDEPCFKAIRPRIDGRCNRRRHIRACAACARARSRSKEALRMSAADGRPLALFDNGDASDALGQGRAGLRHARRALGRRGAPRRLPASGDQAAAVADLAGLRQAHLLDLAGARRQAR